VAGLLADRLEARGAMRFAALLEAVLTVGLLLAAHADSLFAVQVLVLVRASVSTIVYPTYGVALRHLIADGDVVRANALNAATWSVMFSLGMALGGVMSVLGPEIALGLDALTFVLAAVILGGLPSMPPVEQGVSESWAQVWRDGFGALPGAWRRARLDPVLLEATLAKAAVAFTGAGVWLLIHLEATWLTGLATTGLGLGLLHFIRGVGTGVGPAAAASWLGERAPSAALLRGGQLLTAVGLAAVALSPMPWLALVGVFVWGLGTGANWTLSSALIQLKSPRAWLGRVGALDSALRTLALSVSVFTGAAAIDAGAAPRVVATATIGVGVLIWVVVRVWAERMAAGRSLRAAPDHRASRTSAL